MSPSFSELEYSIATTRKPCKFEAFVNSQDRKVVEQEEVSIAEVRKQCHFWLTLGKEWQLARCSTYMTSNYRNAISCCYVG